MPYFRDLDLDDEIKTALKSVLARVFTLSRTCNTLAQIYDGVQNWDTLQQRNDVTAMVNRPYCTRTSEAAIAYTEAWLKGLDIDFVEFKELVGKELAGFFRGDYTTHTRNMALTFGIIRPAMYWIVNAYCERLLQCDRRLPQFGHVQDSGNVIPALQGWVEETIFGGVLSHKDGKVSNSAGYMDRMVEAKVSSLRCSLHINLNLWYRTMISFVSPEMSKSYHLHRN